MVHLTRLGGPVFALNPDLIERADATPDTVITLVNGSKYVVLESLEELTDLICAFRARIIRASQHPAADRGYEQSYDDAHDGAHNSAHNGATDAHEHVTPTRSKNNVLPMRTHGEQ